MTTITGTSHFVSFDAACRYYRDYGYGTADVQRKLDTGEIHIGKPELVYGKQRWIKIDSGLRYGIEESK
jgi:hypothetical protein